MNKKNVVIEKLNKVAALVKTAFADESNTDESTEAVATKFAEVTLADGETVLSYEGDLAPGTAIFVVLDGEQAPAPEGTHALGGDMEGISIVVDADGMITEVIDERESEEGETEEAMSSEDVEKVVDEKMSTMNEALTAIASGVESLLKLKEEMSEFKAEFAEFKKQPSVETKQTKKFAREDDDLSPFQRAIVNKRKNNK